MKCLAFWAFPPLALLFLLFPEIDLAVAARFWSPEGGFSGSGSPLLAFVRKPLLDWAVGLALLASVGGWAWSHLCGAPVPLVRHRRRLAFLALVLLIGPGLVVNTLFKDQWGRARPHQVQEFGGARDFTPAWVMSDQCQRNCSFVCGDASVGFALLAFGYFGRHRRAWIGAGLAAGSLLGLMRIAQGGHFLSDVVFSGYAVALVIGLLARWLKPDQPG
ncbi:MAG: phosphatase PAP2 family protein [Betaproteobacteria bacterium]|nr:phosphatase PAP2 family protein [Betaproteobacteria bacterium]